MGECEGQWTWHVDAGSYGDVSLADLNFAVAVDWPGATHAGRSTRRPLHPHHPGRIVIGLDEARSRSGGDGDPDAEQDETRPQAPDRGAHRRE